MPATQLKSRSHSLKHVRLHHKSNATERESLGMSTKFHGLKAIAKERNITCSRPRSRAHSYQGFQDPNLPPILLAQSENKLGKTTKIDTLLSENIPIRSQSLATSSLLSQINHRPVKRSSSNSTDCKHIAVQPGKEVVCDAYVEEPIRAQRFSIHSSQSRPCPSLPASQYISYIPRRTMPQRQSTFEVYSSSPLGQERPALGKERRLGSLIANTKADKKEERLFTSGESDLSRIPHLSLCDMDQLVQQITDSTLSYDRGEKMKDELDKQLLDDMIHEYSVPNPSELPRFSIRLKKNKRDSSSKSKSLCFDNEPATRQAEEIQQQKSECQPQLSNRWNKMRRSRSVHISEYQHQLPQDASPEKLPASLQSSQLSLNQITLKQQMQVAKQMEEKEQQPSASPQEMSQSHLLQSQKSEQKYPIRRECWVPNTSSLLRLGPYMERLPGISPIQEPVSRAIRQYWDDFGPHVLIDNQDDKNQPSSVYQNRSPRSWQHARVDLRSPSCRLSETGYSVCLPFYQQALACKEVLYIPDTCYLANQSEMPNNLDAKEEAKHVLLATPNCNSNQQRHTYLVSCPTKPHQETSKHSRPMSRLHLKEALPSVESGYITPHHYHCLPVYPDQSDL
ncbi:unnamed protein product [Protopolystoma xenopodis]|uniref:Uncharacterized protein n=1 Tax=Protopolystoma xenopodis TaxID=117903 RepID=A0A3S5BUB2_9PLAT|nr:unnamed protein product [Protopolystoma xenopodis]